MTKAIEAKKRKALTLLADPLHTKSYGAIARTVKVSGVTLYYWMKQPEFAAELEKRLVAADKRAVMTIRRAAPRIVHVLIEKALKGNLQAIDRCLRLGGFDLDGVGMGGMRLEFRVDVDGNLRPPPEEERRDLLMQVARLLEQRKPERAIALLAEKGVVGSRVVDVTPGDGGSGDGDGDGRGRGGGNDG